MARWQWTRPETHKIILQYISWYIGPSSWASFAVFSPHRASFYTFSHAHMSTVSCGYHFTRPHPFTGIPRANLFQPPHGTSFSLRAAIKADRDHPSEPDFTYCTTTDQIISRVPPARLMRLWHYTRVGDLIELMLIFGQHVFHYGADENSRKDQSVQRLVCVRERKKS